MCAMFTLFTILSVLLMLLEDTISITYTHTAQQGT